MMFKPIPYKRKTFSPILAIVGLICWCFCGYAALNYTITDAYKWYLLWTRGVETQADVLSVQVNYGKGLSKITYQFQTPYSLQPIVVEEDVTRQKAESMTVGSRIPILYDPFSPTTTGSPGNYQFLIFPSIATFALLLTIIRFGIAFLHDIRKR
jgi:hypothetical protein